MTQHAPLFDRRARTAFVVAAVTMIVSAIGFRSAVAHLNVYLRKEPVELRAHLATIPKRLGPWEAVGEDLKFDEAMTEALGTDKYLDRRYAHRDEPDLVMSVHIAYYTGMIDAVPHIPDRCFVASGWEPASVPANYPLSVDFSGARIDDAHISKQTGEPYRMLDVVHPITGRLETVHLPSGDFELRLAKYTPGPSARPPALRRILLPREQPAHAQPRVHPRLGVQALRAIRLLSRKCSSRPSSAPATPPSVTWSSPPTSSQRLLPHLMRCLPDWAEVESAPSVLTLPPKVRDSPMASRVNVKFLSILFICLFLVVGILGGLWYLQRARRHGAAHSPG